LLNVDNIQFAFNGLRILNGIDLKVGYGELIGVVGPNGSGKTTLLRLISGVVKPCGGRIHIDGEDLSVMSPSRKASYVAIVPQNPRLPMGFSVQELVLMGRNPHLNLLQSEGVRDFDISRQALELTGVAHLADRHVDTLSGGEQQRVVIAMALAQDAPLLLLDEPTSNLDLAHQVAIMDMVRGLQKEKRLAVLVALHDLTLAAQYCSRLLVLADGRGFAEGAPCEVLTVENLWKVYGTEVFVLRHPQGGTPVILPASRSNVPPMTI